MVGVIWIRLPSEPTIRELYSDEHWNGYHIAYNRFHLLLWPLYKEYGT